MFIKTNALKYLGSALYGLRVEHISVGISLNTEVAGEKKIFVSSTGSDNNNNNNNKLFSSKGLRIRAFTDAAARTERVCVGAHVAYT